MIRKGQVFVCTTPRFDIGWVYQALEDQLEVGYCSIDLVGCPHGPDCRRNCHEGYPMREAAMWWSYAVLTEVEEATWRMLGKLPSREELATREFTPLADPVLSPSVLPSHPSPESSLD